MKPFTIAVTGINAVDNPGPGTGIARSLRQDSQLPTKIIGLAYDAMEPGLYMDWLFDRRYLMPYPSSEPEVLIERLQQIQQQVGLDCVIPNFDVELPLYIRCAKELESLGIQTYLPTREQFALRNKARLSKVAAFNVNTPQTLMVTSSKELHEAIAELRLPLMIKGPYYGAYRVFSEGEALQRFHQLAAEWRGYPIILQQFVTALWAALKPGHMPKLIIESGRAIVDEAGTLITTVCGTKRLPDGTRAYVVDGGINLLFTSFWYRFDIDLDRQVSGPYQPSVIYGPLCMNIAHLHCGCLQQHPMATVH